VPLSLLLKGAKGVLVSWLNHRSIKVKLGAGREVNVQSVSQLDEVLERLSKMETSSKAEDRDRAQQSGRANQMKSAKPRVVAKREVKKSSKGKQSAGPRARAKKG
jgi:hypothetical protein